MKKQKAEKIKTTADNVVEIFLELPSGCFQIKWESAAWTAQGGGERDLNFPLHSTPERLISSPAADPSGHSLIERHRLAWLMLTVAFLTYSLQKQSALCLLLTESHG